MGKLTRIVKFIAPERRLSIPAEFLHEHGIQRGDALVICATPDRLFALSVALWERWRDLGAQARRWFPESSHPLMDALAHGQSVRLGSQDRVVLPRDIAFALDRSTRMHWEMEGGFLQMEPEQAQDSEKMEPAGQRSLLEYISANHQPAHGFRREDAVAQLVEEVSVARIDHRDRSWATSSSLPADSMLRSIKVEGVRVPLVLRELPSGAFQVIDGWKRLLAARQIKLRSLPAIVWRGIDDDAVRRLKLLEPAPEVEDTTPRHRLQNTVRLYEDQVALHEIEHITGRRKRTLQRYLRVAQDRAVKDAVESGRLSIFKAEEILKAGISADEALKEGWTVKEIRDHGRRQGRKRSRRLERLQGDA
jgi:ParB-like chromosome segregation protein Spo0J/antitoxin component of MazEF toxin-antitoxin module